MSKVLNKVLYVYDVERNIWFWYNPNEDLFYTCDQMSNEQYALPSQVSTQLFGNRFSGMGVGSWSASGESSLNFVTWEREM